MPVIWYLSFASETEHRGVVLVDGCDTFLQAHLQASLHGVNPGGECVGWPIDLEHLPLDDAQQALFRLAPRLTLLSKAELRRYFGPLVRLDGAPDAGD